MRKLDNESANLHHMDSIGFIHIHITSIDCRFEVIKLSILTKTDMSKVDINGWAPLSVAI